MVTFTYVVPGAENLTGFVTHLRGHLALFRHLKRFNFVFIAVRVDQCVQAGQIFSTLVDIPLRQGSVREIGFNTLYR